MFFSRIFRHLDSSREDAALSGAARESADTLVPRHYFTPARCAELGTSLSKLQSVHVKGITPLES